MIRSRLVLVVTLVFWLAVGLAVGQESGPFIIIKQERGLIKEWDNTRFQDTKPLAMPELNPTQFTQLLKDQPPPYGRAVEPMIEEGQAKALKTPGQPRKADVQKMPFSGGGKLFFSTPSGDASCSAQFVGNSEKVIMTAAHCVVDKDTGQKYSNFTFYRAYAEGGGQQVGIECGAVNKKWKQKADQPPNFAYDYAFFLTHVTSSGGSLGLKMEIPDTKLTAIGYPENYGNSQYMYAVDGSKGTLSGHIVQMVNNPMRNGNSGGAWIGDLNKGDYAVGLNSFHVSGESTSEYGPFFNDETWDLYQFVKQGKCR